LRVIVPKHNYLFVIALLPLLVVTSAVAAPTVSDGCCRFDAGALSAGPVAEARSLFQFCELGEDCGPDLAGIGAELSRPPARFADSPTSESKCAKALPAVPGTLLMVLAGFVCVSLVKDRKMWLAAAACLLSLGHTGLAILPQLAAQLRSKEKIEGGSPPKPARIYTLDGIDRLRSDVEGTGYTGLLRHLAGIPQNSPVNLTKLFVTPAVQSRNLRESREDTLCTQKRRRPGESSAITTSSHRLIQAASCLTKNDEEHACFSPAFIFNSMARSPPSRPHDC